MLVLRAPFLAKPGTLKETSKSQAGSIGIELKVRGLRPYWVTQKRSAVPVWEELLPSTDVCLSIGVQVHFFIQACHGGAGMDETTGEGAAGRNHFGRK